ncbi:MAG: hypothetical protein KF903_13915 [Dokdonella sp.]|uniref:hypothetical protein n=1 Tax=Dokdonella sp. TaxID=2291710 RepID=UPI0025BA0931|nr:hypothetical protein [Dokdonella sp.]MBX3702083.1 hypothetical protein [Dokdonella sp.]
MFKNMDYQDTYASPEHANVRYPSSAKQSIGGWAYVFSQDAEYVYGLSRHHDVQVKTTSGWARYSGKLPNPEDLVEEDPPFDVEDETD